MMIDRHHWMFLRHPSTPHVPMKLIIIIIRIRSTKEVIQEQSWEQQRSG